MDEQLAKAMASDWWPFVVNDRRTAIMARLSAPTVALLRRQLKADDGAPLFPVGPPSDANTLEDEGEFFERLELEMTVDAIEQARAAAVRDVAGTVTAILTAVSENNGIGIMNLAAAEKVLMWLGRAYTRSRAAELTPETMGAPADDPLGLGTEAGQAEAALSEETMVLLQLQSMLIATLTAANL